MPRHVILVGRVDVQGGTGELATSTPPCSLRNLSLNRKRHRSNFTPSPVLCAETSVLGTTSLVQQLPRSVGGDGAGAT